MKIAIPVEDQVMEASISQSFGRAPYYLIFDTQSRECEFIDNSAIASQGGAGIKAAQTMVDSGINALLTPLCGENAAKVLNSANIILYKSLDASAQDNIEAFNAGSLSLLEDIHPGYHGHGGK
ncbi:hypothetical protein Desor_1325 [Desulfosporosinus orientis DSM 765]|uniref:Dinitrogenase iron-molybdenum cofactor biosynthesis domain-containing protein n=1 Tax=Desulfosporosinus orientis (strain ATCC 19365 / DSM 765 / NCIMB 8382 / VKM B-1628 / Singapore I) TaxID=768706 RepID=G7W5P9_DESOD|nr:NifB/NifX family molybdenum-iron cluster-binding protein [Desulfosporosinus orientis]AET66987.1 hypothetical protein Desor_1325 [Desulfosporosinus orientis DSM 765]